MFFITDDIARSQCYDPDSNRWSSAPWKNKLPFSKGTPLVVRNRISFVVEETDSTALWTFSLDSHLLTCLRNWVEIVNFCAVAVDSYIYVIGGSTRLPRITEFRTAWELQVPSLTECARFNTEQNEWKKIALLNEARQNAFGVCKNEKIFIAGGSHFWLGQETDFLKTCEVYNILTDEWQFIASLTLNRTLGSMVLADETLYVLGGRTGSIKVPSFQIYAGKLSVTIECYNHENDEWNDKATVPVNKINLKERVPRENYFKACSLRVFKGVLTHLKPMTESD